MRCACGVRCGRGVVRVEPRPAARDAFEPVPGSGRVRIASDGRAWSRETCDVLSVVCTYYILPKNHSDYHGAVPPLEACALCVVRMVVRGA